MSFTGRSPPIVGAPPPELELDAESVVVLAPVAVEADVLEA